MRSEAPGDSAAPTPAQHDSPHQQPASDPVGSGSADTGHPHIFQRSPTKSCSTLRSTRPRRVGWPFGPEAPTAEIHAQISHPISAGNRPSTSPHTHPVRSRNNCPEGAQEGSRGLERSSTPGKAAPNTRRTPVGVPEDRETTFIRDHRLAFLPHPPADHFRRLDSDSTATSYHRRLEPLSGFWPDLGVAFRGYRVAEPPATLSNPFGDDVPGPDGLRRGAGNRPQGPAIPPARPSGPGKAPSAMCRPNGPTIPLIAHAVRRTAGPFGPC